MTDSGLLPPDFIADDRALDFLNSIAAPSGTDIEWLVDGPNFLAWLEQAGLVPGEVLMRFRAESPGDKLDEVAARARDLREWFRVFVTSYAGERLLPSALAELGRINDILVRDETFRQIEVSGDRAHKDGHESDKEPGFSLRLQRHRRWEEPEDLLLPIAEIMGDLICRPDFERIKNCEGPTCTMWFLDVSKNHTRRWCSMAVCGNRAKAAAHRAKKRAVGSN